MVLLPDISFVFVRNIWTTMVGKMMFHFPGADVG